MTADRFRKLIKRESTVRIRIKLNINLYRQIAIAITRKYLKEKKFIKDKKDEEGLENKNKEKNSR